jgi:hypothetical protein
MSSGARLILSNICLTSLPMYNMRFYLLPGECHKKMNSTRARFFWRGAEDKFKYHMVKWEAVCRPRKFRGLSIINTQIINECLMVKWIWKIYQQPDSLWARILRAKYMRYGDFFRSTGGWEIPILKELTQDQAPVQMGCYPLWGTDDIPCSGMMCG